MSSEDLSGLNLCRSAAAQEIEDLMGQRGLSVLEIGSLDRYGLEQLSRIQTQSGLETTPWTELLRDYGPMSRFSKRQLKHRQQTVIQALARRQSLTKLSQSLSLAAPLLLSLDRQISRFLPDLVALINSNLVATAKQRPGKASLNILRSLSPNVMAFLSSETATSLAIHNWLEGVPSAPIKAFTPLPEAAEVLEDLWLDTDPSVALWASMILRQLHPERSQRLLLAPRTGLPIDATLAAFLQGEQQAYLDIISPLAELPLIQRFEPSTLLHLHRLCSLHHWRPGDVMATTLRVVLILLTGQCEHRHSLAPGSPPTIIASYGKGTILGLANYFGEGNSGHQPELVSGKDGCSALAFSRTGFRELLKVSPVFEQSLLRDLAINFDILLT
jgi:hypothetical protein